MTNALEEHDAAEILADLPGTEEPTRPALAKLSADQQSVVQSFLGGFEGRLDFLEWAQDAIVATLGQADDSWYRDLAMSRSDMACLIVTGARSRWAEEEPPSLESAQEYRQTLAATRLLPACRDAVREFRWSAVDYTDLEHTETHPDPETQRYAAMRPELEEMRDRQRWVVRRGVDGFDDVDGLMSWVLVATQASYAEIDADLSADLWREHHTRDMMLTSPTDHEHGQFFRESLIARRLLPAFNRAARKIANRAGELATDPETTDQSPMEYR